MTTAASSSTNTRPRYQRIAASAGNANRWYVLSVANSRRWPADRRRGSCRSCWSFAALLLIAALVVALRRGQKALVEAAHTDALTGLCNRRQLVADLEAHLARATDADPVLLILCDLNGFKAYNDTFGHPAGDALLARLGAALARDIDGHGRAYRIGGDEFCVLARPGRAAVDPIVAIASRALSEHGEGFSITTSHGAVLLPADATTADRGDARGRPAHVREQEQQPGARRTRRPSMRSCDAIHERDPEWAQRLVATADLAGAVCQQLEPAGRGRGPDPAGRPAARHRQGRHPRRDPAQAHRPDTARVDLHPAGPVRSVNGSCCQRPRSSRSPRWSARHGSTTTAPVTPMAWPATTSRSAPRIVAACAALAAMTSDRPYADERDTAAALEELNRAAGTQFDPQVVAALQNALLQPASPAHHAGQYDA